MEPPLRVYHSYVRRSRHMKVREDLPPVVKRPKDRGARLDEVALGNHGHTAANSDLYAIRATTGTGKEE